MEIRLPFIYGLEELSPLLAYLLIYVVVLMFFRLYLLPTMTVMRSNSKLNDYIQTLFLVLRRIAVFGFLLLGFLWALEELGWADEFYNTLMSIPNFQLPSTNIIISGLLILFAIVAYLVIAPAFIRRRNRS